MKKTNHLLRQFKGMETSLLRALALARGTTEMDKHLEAVIINTRRALQAAQNKIAELKVQ